MKEKSNKEQAFTLVELMVVLSIIALLAAILFPVFASAKRESIKTVCASNLHQLGSSLYLYSIDNNDRYPWGVSQAFIDNPNLLAPWIRKDLKTMPKMEDVLMPYVKNKSVFHCPGDGSTFRYDGKSYPDYAAYNSGTSYWFNIGDVASSMTTLAEDPYERCIEDPPWQFFHSTEGPSVFNKTGNVFFCDGHVKWSE